MMQKILHKAAAFGLGLFLISVAPVVQAQSAWQQKKDDKGIKVWVREVEGQPFKESKATVQFTGTVDQVVKLLLDYPSYAKWATRVLEARLVEKVGENIFYSYSLNDAPWPVSDRDIVLKNTLTREASGSATIKMVAVEGKVTPVKDKVRMTYFDGYYAIKPIASGQVEITYQAILDPAGSVPAWMANMAVVDTPFELLENMRKQLTGK